jgi:hypothetical protein
LNGHRQPSVVESAEMFKVVQPPPDYYMESREQRNGSCACSTPPASRSLPTAQQSMTSSVLAPPFPTMPSSPTVSEREDQKKKGVFDSFHLILFTLF